MAEYQSFAKARNYYIPNYKYYPSNNYTYCSALDEVCQSCKQKWVQDYYAIGNTPSIPFCMGTNGCVCIAYCELPGWSDTVIGNQCSSAGAAAVNMTKLYGAIAISVGTCALFLAVAIGVRYLVKRMEWDGTSGRTDRSIDWQTNEVLATLRDLRLSLSLCLDSGERARAKARAIGSTTCTQRLESDAREAHRVRAAPH